MILFQLPLHVIIYNIVFALIDIFIISFIFYKFYQILSQTKAVQVIKGLFFFVVLYILSRFLRLDTFSWLLDQIAGVLVLAVIILFQPELRRVLTKLGQSDWVYHLMKKDPNVISNIISAVHNLSLHHIGALIIFERNVGLRNIIESGTVLNAKVSVSLIMTIFNNKSALHDGAIIIKNDLMLAASCFLPLSESTAIKAEYGTRHRAALGITEDSDAVSLVVSEETGKISIAYDGKLYPDINIDQLRKKLFELLEYEEESEARTILDENK